MAVKKRALQGLQLKQEQDLAAAKQQEDKEGQQQPPGEHQQLLGEEVGGEKQNEPLRGQLHCSCHYEYLIVGKHLISIKNYKKPYLHQSPI